MARKKRTIIIDDPDEEKALLSETPEEAAELLEQEKTQELLADFQSRFADQPAKILIEKYDEEGDWALCHKYPLASFEQEQIKIEFGGGKYRGTLYDPNGKYVKGGRINFKFAESLLKEPLPQKPENPLENPVVAMIIKSMESQQHTMLELTKSMMAAQGAAQSTGKGGLGEVVEVVKSLNSMTPKDKPLDSFKETLGLMKLFKEATGDGDGDSKGGLLSDVKEFLEIWPTIKDQLATIKPPTTPATTALPGVPQKEIMDPLTQKIVELVPKFVAGARTNADVPQWGNYLLDVFDTEVVPLLLPVMKERYGALVQNDDDVYDVILRLAKDPAERENIFKSIPPLAPYKAWILQVVDEAVRLSGVDAESGATENDNQIPISGGGSSILTAVAEAKTNGAAKPA